VSVIDILRDPKHLKDTRGRPVDLKDKLVLVGMAAAGLRDVFVTPFSAALPGVEKHANAVENILHNRFFDRKPRHVHYDHLIVLGLGVLLGVFLPRVPSITALGLSALLLVAHFAHAQYQFNVNRVVVNFIYPAVTILLSYALIIFYRFLTEERAKREIRGMFERYLDPAVVSELQEDPSKIDLGGTARSITAFFSDVQGFSTISEKLDPRELVLQLNDYLTVFSNILMAHKGLVDKFEGDAVVAMFNAPNDVPDHAYQACAAAIELQKRNAELRDRFVAMGRDRWFTRIGLNTGPATVGNVGAEQHVSYTMIGDNVNVAARLEGANKQFGTYTMISEATHRPTEGRFDVRELGLIRVVGKKTPLRVYELIDHAGAMPDHQRRAVELFLSGLEKHRHRAWDEAIRCFKQALEEYPEDAPSRAYISRCRALKEDPPPDDWDTVWVLEQK